MCRICPSLNTHSINTLRSRKLRIGTRPEWIAPVARRSRFAFMNPSMTTTAFELPGYRVVKTFGVVRGIIVRSRSIIGTIGAGLQTLVGGNITILTDLCEKTRQHALELCLQHAQQLGANAIIGLRYDATEIMQGVTEVLCYGTAVQVEPK